MRCGVYPLATDHKIFSFTTVKRLRASSTLGRCCRHWAGLFALTIAAMAGIDAGDTASRFLQTIDALPPVQAEGAWVRIRGLSALKSREAIDAERAALRELRARGWRVCALIEWEQRAWASGTREAGGRRVALDLREVRRLAQTLGEQFADDVDAWEIGNEPDISFSDENPETTIAYLKACRAGLLAGARGRSTPQIWMPPMALPPGPYFEALVENGLGAATDAINFHCYGYAEDAAGVYSQFHDAVEKHASDGEGRSENKNVAITEYGYGSLMTSDGREGRERQARWFESVSAQWRKLKVSAALAFVWVPYREQGRYEFGLLTEAEETLSTTPAAEVVLRGLGRKTADVWTMPVSGDAEVALDFIARDGLRQAKRFTGYFAQNIALDGRAAGWGEVVVYNFSQETLSGDLELGTGLSHNGETAVSLELASGERVVVPVRVNVDRALFRHTRSETRFVSKKRMHAQLVTGLWPDPATLQREIVTGFAFDQHAVEARMVRLQTRSRAAEEPALEQNGRWLTTVGTGVREDGEHWLIEVASLPAEPARPAMVELPLPEDFRFEPGMLLEFRHRLASGQGMANLWFDVYFRTENGNLYQVWPRREAGQAWMSYAEAAENFTMAFYGRAALPWRFLENRPVALVFFLRPERLPVTLEIEGAAITRRVRGK